MEMDDSDVVYPEDRRAEPERVPRHLWPIVFMADAQHCAREARAQWLAGEFDKED